MSNESDTGVPAHDRPVGARPGSAPEPDRYRRQAGIAAGVLGAAVLYAMLPFLAGLVGGPVLYVAGLPLHRWLAPRIGVRRSALACAVIALVLVIAPLAFLVTTIVGRIPDTVRGIEASEAFRRLLSLRVGSIDIGAHAQTLAGSGLDWLSRQTPALIGNLARSTVNLLLALFGFYYLLAPQPPAWAWMKRVLPLPDSTVETLRARFHAVTSAVLLGVALTALVQGTIVGGAFAIVGLPDPVFWGAMTAIASVVPAVGSTLVWLPGTVVLVLEQRIGAAVALALIGVVIVSNIDNLVRLLVLKRVANIHPFVTLAGAFAGINLFGLVGLLLGPLLLSFLIELVHTFDPQGAADAITP